MVATLFAMGILGNVFLLGMPYWIRSTTESSLREWAKERRLEFVTLEIVTTGARPGLRDGNRLGDRQPATPGRADAVIRETLTDVETKGRMVWNVGLFGISEVEFLPSLTAQPRLPPEPLRLIDGDVDDQVLAEVNRRLDGITNQENWMETYDLDGSGHIDEEEWSILRGNLMAAVRAELGEPGVTTVAAPDQTGDEVTTTSRDGTEVDW